MKLSELIRQMCRRAGEGDAFADDFMERLAEDEEILQEYLYYLQTGTFACNAKAEGYSVLDIMVWQMDHFKAWMDRDTEGTRKNRDRMVLLAFDTLLKMKKDPQKYILRMQTETGTDYEGHYN